MTIDVYKPDVLNFRRVEIPKERLIGRAKSIGWKYSLTMFGPLGRSLADMGEMEN